MPKKSEVGILDILRYNKQIELMKRIIDDILEPTEEEKKYKEKYGKQMDFPKSFQDKDGKTFNWDAYEQRFRVLSKDLGVLEKYNKELDKVYDNEYDALDKLIEAEEELANVDYSKLSSDGKAYYDNIHSAYVQATSDIEEVRNAVGQTIDLFGSAQFDSWEIDVSSLKSASELADQITAKISELDDEEDKLRTLINKKNEKLPGKCPAVSCQNNG